MSDLPRCDVCPVWFCFRHVNMATPVPLLAVCESDRTSLLCGPPTFREHPTFPRDGGGSRNLTFSRDGSLLAWCNGHGVSVVRTSDGSSVATLALPKTTLLRFSPLADILVTWQPYTKSAEAAQGDANLRLWELPGAGLRKALFQKKAEAWCPSWSQDEKVAVRIVSNELHFFEDNDFNVIANKLHVQKISNFELSPGSHPFKVTTEMPAWSRGAASLSFLIVPVCECRCSRVRCAYTSRATKGCRPLCECSSTRSLEDLVPLWPPRASSRLTVSTCYGTKKASAVLVTASTEVDKSGASYYGEQTLHYLHVGGETALVQLPKNGPIYDVAWSPNSSEFCVVYGFMPAKATVFNLKCDPVFDFGTGPRNAVYYSPQGHILVLAGFGNLRGQMEVWDAKKYKQVSKCQAPDATHFSWCPDGEHVVTATCAPRLRVGNGFKVCHYTGAVAHEHQTPAGSELWEVRWQSFPDGTFPERPVRRQTPAARTDAPAQAYRPPALRHLPAAPTSKLHEEEAPQNARQSDKALSKAALKNQKKREARKAAKQESKPEAQLPSDPAPITDSQSTETCGDLETDRKIKNVKKKLKAIEELKEQQASGKVLQKNQLEKMQKEDQLLEELRKLHLQP
ncbi:eukaryotic translation initiation factor 2A isoform X1 [Syngnathoides biaculeatus]|uniref:eukaryotic translation initiation factor 2A isoform X1 n=1 Tax=Syngnathoides biaculeatus TaxID=300417 RepID=UPI002ADDD78C|nr:eukaryotic translation initiation factor 2A isoform X1 [Syngnathoides biaculeatus]